MSGELTFLPYLRRGLVQAVGVPDAGGTLAGGPSLTASVAVQERPAQAIVRLLGPESVTAVAAAQILRSEPRPDSTDVEPNHFAFVELASPDLPWMLTPARADSGRLRPWLVLVVVRERDGVTLESDVLHAPVSELPDLAESWAWAHVQSRVGIDSIPSAVEGATGEVVARLMCPRRMEPGAAWLACVVPAFDAGRRRGLGEAVVRGTELAPAWGAGGEIDLPVYHSWRFQTGLAGDFEALCRRLKPDGDAADVGRHAMDVGTPGLVSSAPRPVLLDMEGALETPGITSRPWPEHHRETFQREVTKLLDTAARRATDRPADPVVAPPFYGSAPTGARAVPDKGWLRELNDDPVARAAAGLGAAVVRAEQESLVAAAWDQAGALRATATALNQARLAAEAAGSRARRAAGLEDADLLQLTAPMHAFLPSGQTTVRAALAASLLPAGLFSAAYQRRTRPGTPLARDWPGSGRLAARHAGITLAATGEPGPAPPLHFAEHGVLHGAQTADPALTDAADEPALAEPSPALESEVTSMLGLQLERLRRRGSPPPLRTVAPSRPLTADVSGIAGTVRRALDPMASVRAALAVRIPALAGRFADAPIPTTLSLSPVFEDPLSEDLTRLSAAWMLPGAEAIARNRVRLVTANPEFIGALLVGANHELGRELLWRGYPVASRATFFHRFWNYAADPARIDVGELTGWKRGLSVAENLARDTAGETAVATVIVVRGDLVRRYPSAHFFLHEAQDGEPRPGAAPVEPVFLGALGPDTVFFGFDVAVDDVRARYLLAIEEQAGAPRLGLDIERKGHFSNLPSSWDDVSWGHQAGSQEELDGLTHARADSSRLAGMAPLDGVTWGRNAAHLARACWQRPFRMYIPASALV